jgi:hypothetical protein
VRRSGILLFNSKVLDTTYASPIFRQKLMAYWSSSQLELIATCVMIPLGLLAAFAGEDS